MNKTNIEAMTKSFGALPQTAQQSRPELTDYSKRSFVNSTKAMERLLVVKSLDKAIEIKWTTFEMRWSSRLLRCTRDVFDRSKGADELRDCRRQVLLDNRTSTARLL